MTDDPFITRVDPEAPLSLAAVEAEQALFAHYRLDYQVHFVDMENPDLRLRVLETGRGEPILMVPGGSGDALFFAALMAELAGRRLIALNRPGGGMSDAVDHRKVDLRRLAVDSIGAVIDAFGLDRVPIICNSMGGLWSFYYALACPERVSRMVQMGCPALALGTSAPFFMRLLSVPLLNRLIAEAMVPDSIDKTLDGLRNQGSSREDIGRMPPALGEAYYHVSHLPTHQETWKTLVAAVANIAGANPRYALRAPDLARISCPVQFIWGGNDPFGGLEVARQIVEIMPDARLHTMNVGHLPFLDRPVETALFIREFLAEETTALETGQS